MWVYHCTNKLVVLITDWLLWLQASCGCERFALMLETNCLKHANWPRLSYHWTAVKESLAIPGMKISMMVYLKCSCSDSLTDIPSVYSFITFSHSLTIAVQQNIMYCSNKYIACPWLVKIGLDVCMIMLLFNESIFFHRLYSSCCWLLYFCSVQVNNILCIRLIICDISSHNLCTYM